MKSGNNVLDVLKIFNFTCIQAWGKLLLKSRRYKKEPVLISHDNSFGM